MGLFMCLLPDTRNIILRYYYLFFSLLGVWSDIYADLDKDVGRLQMFKLTNCSCFDVEFVLKCRDSKIHLYQETAINFSKLFSYP